VSSGIDAVETYERLGSPKANSRSPKPASTGLRPKSNAAYVAYNAARAFVQSTLQRRPHPPAQ